MVNVEVISTHTIKPSHPTPAGRRYLRSSLFDHANDPILMPIIFFYSNNSSHGSHYHRVKGSNPDVHSLISTNTSSNVMNRLKDSLPKALSMFYPLAGRVEDVNNIVCNDEGVPYVEAKAKDVCLEDVIHKADQTLLDQLVTCHGQEGFTKLLLAIQVTSFACGGVAIGVKMSHSISDAFSHIMFINSWAALAHEKDSGRLLNLKPYFEVSKVFPPPQSKVDESREPNTDLIEERPMAKRFVFNEAKLVALRSKLYSNNPNTNILPCPSLTMVLSAFIWSRIKVACHGLFSNPPFEAFHAVNFRPKVKPPNENFYYFGNMVINAIVRPSNKGDLLYNFLEEMKESIGRIIREDVFVREIKAGREDLTFMMDFFETANRGEIAYVGFSNLGSLPIYESDFGWGKPVWVTTATLVYKDLVILIPTGPSSKHIDAYVNLSEQDMAKLVKDEEFMSFVSCDSLPRASSKM